LCSGTKIEDLKSRLELIAGGTLVNTREMKDSDKQLQYLSIMIAASVFPSISLQSFNVSGPYYLDKRFETTELPVSFSTDVLGENYGNLKNAVNTGKNLLKSIIIPAR
jgi:hypothetical protein